MSGNSSDTQSLKEQETFIKNYLLPKKSEMQCYLGAVDYNCEFCHHKQPGQASWEFEERDTKANFKAFIIGEVADGTYGILLKGKENYNPPKSNPVSHFLV